MFLESSLSALAGAVFTALLAAIARFDIGARRIPNGLVLALVVSGACASLTIERNAIGATGALAGLALGLALWAPLWLMRVLGAGDVKLAAAVGMWLGPAGVIDASLLAAIVGGVLALVVLVRRRRIMALASGVALWVGALQRGEMTKPLVNNKSELLPYGVALSLGAALAGWLPRAWLAL